MDASGATSYNQTDAPSETVGHIADLLPRVFTSNKSKSMHYFWALKIRLGELSSFLANPQAPPCSCCTRAKIFFFFLKTEWVTQSWSPKEQNLKMFYLRSLYKFNGKMYFSWWLLQLNTWTLIMGNEYMAYLLYLNI